MYHDAALLLSLRRFIACVVYYQMFKSKVAHGLTLSRDQPRDNRDRKLPIDTVEAHKYVRHADDAF